MWVCLGADCILNFVHQYYQWIKQLLPQGDSFFVLGLATFAWAIWKTRNKSCFEKKRIYNPSVIVYQACTFLKYWAGLLKDLSKEDLIRGVESLLQTVTAHRQILGTLFIKLGKTADQRSR